MSLSLTTPQWYNAHGDLVRPVSEVQTQSPVFQRLGDRIDGDNYEFSGDQIEVTTTRSYTAPPNAIFTGFYDHLIYLDVEEGSEPIIVSKSFTVNPEIGQISNQQVINFTANVKLSYPGGSDTCRGTVMVDFRGIFMIPNTTETRTVLVEEKIL